MHFSTKNDQFIFNLESKLKNNNKNKHMDTCSDMYTGFLSIYITVKRGNRLGFFFEILCQNVIECISGYVFVYVE